MSVSVGLHKKNEKDLFPQLTLWAILHHSTTVPPFHSSERSTVPRNSSWRETIPPFRRSTIPNVTIPPFLPPFRTVHLNHTNLGGFSLQNIKLNANQHNFWPHIHSRKKSSTLNPFITSMFRPSGPSHHRSLTRRHLCRNRPTRIGEFSFSFALQCAIAVEAEAEAEAVEHAMRRREALGSATGGIWLRR